MAPTDLRSCACYRPVCVSPHFVERNGCILRIARTRLHPGKRRISQTGSRLEFGSTAPKYSTFRFEDRAGAEVAFALIGERNTWTYSDRVSNKATADRGRSFWPSCLLPISASLIEQHFVATNDDRAQPLLECLVVHFSTYFGPAWGIERNLHGPGFQIVSPHWVVRSFDSRNSVSKLKISTLLTTL
jgi:hypothetical protein